MTATPAPTEPVELASGTFISREHETTGTARILRLPDGQQILRLEGFETSNGPALFVYLSQNPADGEDGAVRRRLPRPRARSRATSATRTT